MKFKSREEGTIGGVSERARWAALSVASILGVVAFAIFAEDDSNAGPTADDAVVSIYADEMPPARAQSNVPLGRPLQTNVTGNYEFLATQEDGTPVSYDPCREIAVVVNNRTLPSWAGSLVKESLEETSRITGLQFRIEGETAEAPVSQREIFQSNRYGDRWAPVLVAWSDPDESDDLDGDTAGFAGSSWVTADAAGNEAYVSGEVILDGPQFEEIYEASGNIDELRAIVMHEVAHLVGLDHVDDSSQLMYPDGNPEVIDFQSGDIAGLVQLGAGRCFPEL